MFESPWWASMLFGVIWEMVGPLIIAGIGWAVGLLYAFFKVKRTEAQAAVLGNAIDVYARALAAKIFASRNPAGAIVGSVIRDIATGSLGANITPQDIPQEAIDYVKTTAASELKKFGIDGAGIAFRMAPRVAAQLGQLEAVASTSKGVEKAADLR